MRERELCCPQGVSRCAGDCHRQLNGLSRLSRKCSNKHFTPCRSLWKHSHRREACMKTQWHTNTHTTGHDPRLTHTPGRKSLNHSSYKCHFHWDTSHLPRDTQKSKSLPNIHTQTHKDVMEYPCHSCIGPRQGRHRQRQRCVTFSPQPSHLQRGESPSLPPDQTLYQTSPNCCTHSAAPHRIRRGTKRGEKHLFNEPCPGRLSLPFSPFLCCRPALRSTPPPQHHQKHCTSDGSSSIQHRDLWSLIDGKWTRGWGCPEGRPLPYFLQILRRKGKK